MIVEILSFDGCPNSGPVRRTLDRIAHELGLEPEVREMDVPDIETARRLRFLGSPTVRVDGHDIEPGAGERTDVTLGCRIFQTDEGARGQPDEHWIREALQRAATRS